MVNDSEIAIANDSEIAFVHFWSTLQWISLGRHNFNTSKKNFNLFVLYFNLRPYPFFWRKWEKILPAHIIPPSKKKSHLKTILPALLEYLFFYSSLNHELLVVLMERQSSMMWTVVD